jgi:hypothetical protein
MGIPARARAPSAAGRGLGDQPQAGAAPVARGGLAGPSVRNRKRRRLGDSTVPAERLRAERPNHVWAFDFQFDQTADGRAIKLLNIVDEFTRESLVMLVERSIDAEKVVARRWSGCAPSAAPHRSSCDPTTARR